MEIWVIWLVVAAVLIVLEVISQMMWAFCLAVGALGAMACTFFGVDMVWQVVVLSVLSVVAYLVFLPLFKRWHARTDAHKARTGMDALLGRRATVIHAIHPGQLGRARIDGDNWQVKAPSANETIPAGAEVVVTSYDSIILTVNLPE
ncbi:MAG: NfeD family protein [Muribaculaceae bacterium]|nr:NfeD family protein [Muribaculaceae bacterium]